MEYICLLDETETSQRAPDAFFVYGALLIPTSSARALHDQIESIRLTAGLPASRALKWHMSSVTNVTQAALDGAKQAVLQAIGPCGGRLFTSVVLRDIAGSRAAVGDAHLFGANTVLEAIGKTLQREDAKALFLFDRFPSIGVNKGFAYLGRRMEHGLGHLGRAPSLPYAAGFGFVDSTSTRIGSAMDISLGGFARCFSNLTRPPPPALGPLLAPILAKNSLGQTYGWGIRIRPYVVRESAYQVAYARMMARLRSLGLLVP